MHVGPVCVGSWDVDWIRILSPCQPCSLEMTNYSCFQFSRSRSRETFESCKNARTLTDQPAVGAPAAITIRLTPTWAVLNYEIPNDEHMTNFEARMTMACAAVATMRLSGSRQPSRSWSARKEDRHRDTAFSLGFRPSPARSQPPGMSLAWFSPGGTRSM